MAYVGEIPGEDRPPQTPSTTRRSKWPLSGPFCFLFGAGNMSTIDVFDATLENATDDVLVAVAFDVVFF